MKPRSGSRIGQTPSGTRPARTGSTSSCNSKQGQRLEVLGQLAGGVAHDFDNLLAVILNYAACVAEELAATPQSESMAAASRDVGQIQRAAERATALTHQLLAFARREVIQKAAQLLH